jgi:succinate dehydrogenase / fumarate reductase flavoprotein subunit
MQGLADGYFVLPYTIGHYFATSRQPRPSNGHGEFKKVLGEVEAQTKKLLAIKGRRTVNSFHKELGQIMWEKCGMARHERGLNEALQQIPGLREEFWKNVTVAGSGRELNQNLEHAGRVADFLEFAELMCVDALYRNESCGGHFRSEHQTEDGEARRDDTHFAHVAAWEYTGAGRLPVLHKESLAYEEVHMSTRSYK